MHFGWVEKHSLLLIENEGVVLPGIPQTLGNLQELIGHLVAQVVGRVFGPVIIQGGAFQRRSYDVPAGSAATDMIDGGKLTGHGVRVAIGGGQGCRQANVGGIHRQCGQQSQRLKAVKEDGMGLFGYIQSIPKENEIQLGRFGLASQTPIVFQVYRAIGDCFAMPPGCHVAAGPREECPDS